MERFVPNTEKAREEREEKPKVPSSDPAPEGLGELVAGAQPQLQREQQPPNISEMKPLTREAYGGGMYAAEEEGAARRRDPRRPPASVTQSADGPEEATVGAQRPSRPPPPSTGDRDLDITGQSYIQ